MNENVSIIGTATLTGQVLNIVGSMGISVISLKWISGTVTYSGSASVVLADGSIMLSTQIPLDSQNFEMTSINPIDGFVVDATLGSCIVVWSN